MSIAHLLRSMLACSCEAANSRDLLTSMLACSRQAADGCHLLTSVLASSCQAADSRQAWGPCFAAKCLSVLLLVLSPTNSGADNAAWKSEVPGSMLRLHLCRLYMTFDDGGSSKPALVTLMLICGASATSATSCSVMPSGHAACSHTDMRQHQHQL